MRPLSFLHTADIHIDADSHSRLNPVTGIPTAWESNAAVVRFLAEQAVEHKVDAFISSGDEFKGGRPSQEAVLMLADALTPLAEAGIPVLLLDGNHNRIGVQAGHRTAIVTLAEILRARGGIAHASQAPELVELGDLQVATLPWLNKNAVLGVNDLSPADGDRKVADYALAELERLTARADSSRPLVMAGHVTVAGTPRGSETELTHMFSEPILDVARLEQLPFAYGALGHIHTPQPVGSGIYRYSGSPNRLTFTDEHDVKAGNLVTVGGESLNVTAVPTPARTLLTLDLAQPTDPADIPEGALVRVVLPDGETEVPRTIRRDIAKAGACIVATKTRPAPAQTSARPALAQTITPLDALRSWAQATGVADVDRLVKAAADLPGAPLS